jgi:hypothetical protein
MEPQLDTTRWNDEAKLWGRGTNEALKQAWSGLGARRTGLLLRELRVRTGMQYGRVNRVTFAFPRYMVFLEKGASKGYGGKKGSTWSTKGTKRKTNPASLGRMGTGPRQARPGYNPTMEKRVPILAELLAKYYADMAINNIRIK